MENSSTNLLAPNSRLPDSSRLLPDSFFQRRCLDVARSLLGMGLVRRLHGTDLHAELVEVEAYLGDEDPASPAYLRRTPRNQVMFERGGTCYVYLSHGMHYCVNVVTGPQGKAEAVLLRQIVTGPRIGISKGRTLPFRFSVRGSRWVSRPG